MAGCARIPPAFRRVLIFTWAASTVLLALFFPIYLHAQEPTKLYLKDGTYQFVKSYEIRGDRLRFYSVERSDWEEIPLSMADLEATKRAKAQESSHAEEAIQKARELEKEHFERPVADSGPQVAPGVHLPPDEGIYTYDGLRLVRLIQSNGEIVTDKKRMALNLAVPGPFFKNRQFVVLPGAKAAVRMSGQKPTFYAEFADGLGGRLQLIKVKSGNQDRIVENIETGIRPSHASESRSTLPLTYVKVAPGLFKLTPVEALPPGEYAFAELIQGKLNLDLWDFGIDGKPRHLNVPDIGVTQSGTMSEQPPDRGSPDAKRQTTRPFPGPGDTREPH